ncbi:MAG: CDP-diacylglycerol--serine O-phosphatidyltransferase [Halobacteriovoraceae bacterium]|nr:CDP-diacylglycerol--serine O-phosphatidyltransferase [Halobacteriovoraceae bacterium]
MNSPSEELADQDSRTKKSKLVFFLPNIFTALNMACGFMSILLGLKGSYYYASIILILGSIFDSVDGRIARLTGTQSHFGEEFDSISDVISFGVAPSLIIYHQFLKPLGRIGILVAFIYLLCGALRLARFNANISKVDSNYFQGLPIPSAAIAIIGLVLLTTEFPILLKYNIPVAIYVFIYSILMITSFPFPSFKNSEWVRKHKKQTFAIILFVMCLTAIYETFTFILFINLYVVGSVIYFLFHRGELSDVLRWEN